MIRPNWQADCPKCVASKFTCDEHYRAGVGMTDFVTPEIECPKCDNLGFMWPFGPICSECAGEGWRPMTPEEEAEAAERQAEERAENGWAYPTLDEQHRAAWEEKQELRR